MNKRLTIAIDPGLNGAIAYFLDSVFIGIRKIPLIKKGIIDELALCNLILNPEKELNIAPVDKKSYVLESVKINYQGGKVQIKTLAEHVGFIRGILMGNERIFVEVIPTTWQKFCWQGITTVKNADGKNDTKTTSFVALQRLFPELVESVRIKAKPYFDDGLVDATLIGYYSLKNL